MLGLQHDSRGTGLRKANVMDSAVNLVTYEMGVF